MNFRKILIICGVLFSAKSFAFSQKSICNQIGADRYKCEQAGSICFWDDEDQRCEALRTPARCAQYNYSPSACNASSGCAYDDEDQRCEEFGNPGGPPTGNQGCYLNNGQYVPNGYRARDSQGRWLTCVNGSWLY
jgi:hypothetical protein